MPNCVCSQYRPLYSDLEQVLKEKNETIDKLIKEHLEMRQELDTAREALLEIRGKRYPNGVPSAIKANVALIKMDEIRKGYNANQA